MRVSRYAALTLLAAAPHLANAQAAQGAPAQGAPAGAGAVRGVVYDSLAGRPLAGALVQVVARGAPATARTATTDSAGAFRLDSLPPGTYLVGFLAPLLDVLDVELAPREVVVAGGRPEEVSLAVPGLAKMRAALCATDPGAPGDSTGLLIGTVRSADTDGPVPGARVVLTWSELVIDGGRVRTERRRVPVPVRESGTYVACDAPADTPLAASAEAPGRATGLVEVALGPRRFLRRDLVLGDSSAATAGPAQLAGLVRDPTGRPLAGVRLQVWGTNAQAVSGPDGRFTLAGLPTGSRTLEARAIGYTPSRTAVDLARGRPAAVQFALRKAPPTIDRVTVYGKAAPAAPWQKDFDRRRQAGFGRFFTELDLGLMRPLYVSDILRRTPGVVLSPARGIGYAVRMQEPGGLCAPSVVLDGLPTVQGADEIDLLVPPDQLGGVEVFRGPVGTPLDYGGLQNTGCGEVLLWTKR